MRGNTCPDVSFEVMLYSSTDKTSPMILKWLLNILHRKMFYQLDDFFCGLCCTETLICTFSSAAYRCVQ